ncbi:MAG: hypothetical protein ACT6T0_08605 [Nevskia sp.]|uniref:hypothetical protein n=1 Tax=Nevskia sp. TaxID=1929292 RepID=UPI0040351344
MEPGPNPALHAARWRAAAAAPLLLSMLMLSGCGGGSAANATPSFEDPPEVAFGERLFLETRFAQFYASHSPDSVNAPLASGDPAVAALPNASGPALGGPFAGQSINCRQCHLVDEQIATPGAGARTYADFARRSVITERGDGPALTTRNSPPLVNATVPRAAALILHADGEFTNVAELARATLTGRNTGWLPGEEAQAIAHIARVIREDDGSGALAADAGGSYRAVLSGTSASLKLPAAYRLDVNTASDAEIVDRVATLIGVYVDQLRFVTNADGVSVNAPYDLFLARNGLPATPAFGESDLDYARRLRGAVDALTAPQFVAANVLRRFQFHPQAFAFTAAELRGLRVFLREPADPLAGPNADELAAGGIGNCVSCHAPPQFSDFGLHNTGVSQLEYDGLHGAGAFAALAIPNLAERTDPARADALLPATAAHPARRGQFRAIAAADAPGRSDLGAWSVFANDDFPGSQAALRSLLCNIALPARDCGTASDDTLLADAVASFKTPGLRDLGDSQPYLHDGSRDSLEATMAFYAESAALARAGQLRNGDPRLAGIVINAADQADLAAFLRALNEDYN